MAWENIIAWEKKPTNNRIVPYYYQCEDPGMGITLELKIPYEDDPWTVRMCMKEQTVLKECFRLRGKDRQDVPESLDDLEKAKEKAFKIVIGAMKAEEDHYRHIVKSLEFMKEGVS